MTNFERRVHFQPGYNYLHETGPQRRGQCGMRLRFLLIGPEGASQFLMNTMWTPLGEVDAGDREPCHVDYWQHDKFGSYGLVRPPSGWDLGYHWTTPQYDGQDSMECDLLPDGQCFYDGSGLAADDVLRDFIAEGEDAVWRWLEKRYQWCLDTDAERVSP